MAALPATPLRELGHRRNDGIDATPLWDAQTDRVSLALTDEHSGESLNFEVAPAEALTAFHHPFAYAHDRGLVMSGRPDPQSSGTRRSTRATPSPTPRRTERSPMSETPNEYNAKIVAEFRANHGHVGGMWQETPLLLLHHTGAKSCASRVNPVAYLPDDRRYMIWAANGGAPSNPDWYHNLKAHPNTTVEVASETINVVAQEETGAERERLFARAAERYPQLRELAHTTDRLIPIITLTPQKGA